MSDLDGHNLASHDPASSAYGAEMMGFNIDYTDPLDEVYDPEDPAPTESEHIGSAEQAALEAGYEDFFVDAPEVSPAAAYRAGWVAGLAYPRAAPQPPRTQPR